MKSLSLLAGRTVALYQSPSFMTCFLYLHGTCIFSCVSSEDSGESAHMRICDKHGKLVYTSDIVPLRCHKIAINVQTFSKL